MTEPRLEATATYGVRETYEQLRESVTNNEARAAWLDHDRRLSALTATYQNLKDDPRYTEEHKASQMWETYQRESQHISRAGAQARELLEKEARGHEMMALPRPKGESVHNVSTERLIAAQNEANRITRKINRMRDKGPSLAPKTGRVLKEEYAKGIEAGGAEGAARCKGVLLAADELGVSEEEFLGGLRTEEQRAMLDKARRLRQMAFSIGTRIPEPPLRRPADSRPQGSGKLFIPQTRPVQLKRAPSWK